MLDNLEDQSKKVLALISDGQEQALVEFLSEVLPINCTVLHRLDERQCTILMKLVRLGLIEALKVIIRYDPSVLKQVNTYETESGNHLPDHHPETLINDIIDAVKNDREIQIYFLNYNEDIVMQVLRIFFEFKIKLWLKMDPSLFNVWSHDKIKEALARRILTSGEKNYIEKKLFRLSHHLKDNTTLAMWAASMGLNDLLEVMIQKDRSVLNDVNEEGDTLVILAVRQGHAETVKWLINEDFSLRNRSNHFGETPTIAAAKAGISQTLEALLHDNDSVLKDRDNHGMSPALWAANEGHIELLILMIEIIPSLIEDADNSGNTPAICAAKAGHCIVLKVLIEKFQRVLSQTNNFGQTPLMAAFEATTEMAGNNKAISRHASVVKLIYIYSESISDESNLMHAYMQYPYFPHFYFRGLPMMRDIHQAINALTQALNDYSDPKLDVEKRQKHSHDICEMFQCLDRCLKILNNDIDNIFPELDHVYNVCACRFALLEKDSIRANQFAACLKPATSAQESADLFLIANDFLTIAQETQAIPDKKHHYYIAELLFKYCGESESFQRIRGHVVVSDTVSLKTTLDRLQELLNLHFNKKSSQFFRKSQPEMHQFYSELIEQITEVKTLSLARLTHVYAILQSILKMAEKLHQAQESITLATQLDEIIDDLQSIYFGTSADHSNIKGLSDH